MNILQKFKANKQLAEQTATNDQKYIKFIRSMLPSSIEEKPDKLVVNDNRLVKSIIVGVPRGTKPGYPARISHNFLDDIMALSSKNCIISYSFGVVPISAAESIKMAEQAIYSVNVGLQRTAEKDKNLKDISSELDRKDFFQIGEMLHYGKGKQFSTTLIITIWAKDEDSMRATESRITLVLKKHVIEFDIPKFKMLEAYRAALPIPTTSKDFQVELFSDYAAQLAALQNPNSRTAETGYLVGVDRKTGKQIVVDPSITLHATYTGATGGGKSFAMLTHLRRAYSLLGLRAVYITPKADSETDYRNMAHEIGVNAAILDIGRYGKYNINPLQILHGPNPDKYVFSDHIELLLQFFTVLFRSTDSVNQDNTIVTTLKELYASRGIFKDDPHTWINASWPNLLDLHNYWVKLLEDNPRDVTLNALVNKTAMCEDQWDFLCKKTTIDFSKDFLVFDLSGCPPSIQNAMNVFVTGLLGQLYSKSDKGTILAIDEASVFLEDEKLAEFILRILRMGRSAGLTGWFGTQSVKDFELNPKAAAQFQANIFQSYVFGKNMRKENIPTVQSYFKLSENEVKHLIGCKAGEGIAKIGNECIPLKVELSEYELAILKGKSTKTESQHKSPVLLFELNHPSIFDLVQSEGFCFESWIKGDGSILAQKGFTASRTTNPISGKQERAWLRQVPDNMTLDHFGTCQGIAAQLIISGAQNVVLNHADNVDISAEINGVKVAFEYDRPGIHTQAQLFEKKKRAEQDHNRVVFIGQKTNVKFLQKACGDGNVVQRGIELQEFLKELFFNSTEQENITIEVLPDFGMAKEAL